MNTHAFAGVTFEFVPGADVVGALTAREAGRLFGAAEGHRHAAPPGPGREEPE
jgi:hypothetical protein